MVLIKENEFCRFHFEGSIVLVTIIKSVPSEEEWEWTKMIMLSFYESAEISNKKISIIFDLRLIGILPMKYYKEWSDLFISLKEKTQKYIHKTSILVDNVLIKTSLNCFFSIYTTVRPMKFVDSIDDGKKFVSIS